MVTREENLEMRDDYDYDRLKETGELRPWRYPLAYPSGFERPREEKPMLTCPECHEPLHEFYVNATAVIETLQTVGAEVTIDDLRGVKHDATGAPYLPLFRLDDRLETLDSCTDHHTLDLNDEDATFYCPSCNAELDNAAVWQAVNGEETHDVS